MHFLLPLFSEHSLDRNKTDLSTENHNLVYCWLGSSNKACNVSAMFLLPVQQKHS